MDCMTPQVMRDLIEHSKEQGIAAQAKRKKQATTSEKSALAQDKPPQKGKDGSVQLNHLDKKEVDKQEPEATNGTTILAQEGTQVPFWRLYSCVTHNPCTQK